MSFTMARSAAMLFVAATGTLFWLAGAVHGQCMSGGQTSTGTSTTGTSTSQTNTAQRTGRTRQQTATQNAARQQQQIALQQQAALQQQIALQNMVQQQQIALQNLLQQQQTARQQQPQTSMQSSRQQQQQQQFPRVASTQPTPVFVPISMGSPPTPEEPEEVASRQLNIARALASDAETARREGETALATTLQTRVEERLQRVISKYAGTQAADDAAKLLQKIR